MKDWVKEKLAQINELYPTERIQKSQGRWMNIWKGEIPEDRYPFCFEPLSFQYYNDVFTKEEGLRRYLDEFIYRGFIDDDFIPAFFPGCRQGTIPGMFGAREIVLGKDYSCEQIIHKVEDIDHLPEPKILEHTPAWDWIEMEKYYLEECDGQIPVHVCDMQGPMDVCGQLWGYSNVFVCALEDEDHYRRLMDLATDAYLKLWRTQKELLGDQFIGTHLYGWSWVPNNHGAALSADSMVMISPAFFEEFYQEYLERIAQQEGKLSIHSCGNFKQMIPALAEMDIIQAVNASQMSVEELIDAGWDNRKVIINREETDRARTIFDLVRQHNLHLDVSFMNLWPCDDEGQQIHPDCWTEQDRAVVQERAACVLEAAKV